MKTTFAVLLFLVVLDWVVFNHAIAGGGHTHNEYTYNYYGAEAADTSYTGMNNDEFDKAQAMSAAGDTCVFDYATGWQGCFGGGWYGSASAINGSIVTRVDNIMLRFNIQTDTDFDEQAYGVGGSWHF